MTARVLVYALVAGVAVGGTAFAADALVETDEERLGQLADELANGHDGIDGVLRWSDLEREPVSVAAPGRDAVDYDEGDEGRLSDAVTRALAPLDTSDLEVIQQTVHVDGDRGTIAMRARADGDIVDATLRLARNGQGWLVTSVRVR